ncbi:hypothetical protein [Paenibacillus pseudetheri]|uniref:Uncharacterized protein n=1 Tax=Paenibacillus pseudetheri TaxID=2897682 RepID=A0ABN8FRN4_9BACL|nr:hypothetical protein [Paenibacillus pseudetheri]CAH1058680.1 hypothetical protein PAECIP111894_04856 [Paenibacillus pseudetheri]
MKKTAKILLGALLLSSAISTSAFAASEDTEVTGHFRAPVETYDEDGRLYIDGTPYASQEDLEQISEPSVSNRISLLGTPKNTWIMEGSETYYSGQNMDTYNNDSDSKIKITLQTSSSLTATLTGSLEYGFSAVAKASMSLAVGQTFSKTFTQEFTTEGYHVYSLKSAVKTIKRNYVYYDTAWINETFRSSSIDLNGGSEFWFWSNPIPH